MLWRLGSMGVTLDLLCGGFCSQSLYKDLLTVYKDSDTGDIRVSSYILEVQTSDSDTPLFPRENPHSFCYFIVDSLKRQATIFYGGFIPFW